MIIQQFSPRNYNSGNSSQLKINAHKVSSAGIKNNIAFEGKIPKPQILIKLEEGIAKGLGKIADTKAYRKLIEKTAAYDSLVNEDKGLLFTHLIVLGSTLMSAFYVGKTLANKEMDEPKKKTLAINQGLVWVASTVMAYTFDLSVKKKFNIMLTNFKDANKGVMKTGDLDALVKGFKMAKSMIAVDLVYRFIAPVAVTPLANAIGNRLQHNNKVGHAEAQPKLSKQA